MDAGGGPCARHRTYDWTIEFGGGMQAPSWEVVKASPMQAPDWQAPDMFIYPASMTAVIRMSTISVPTSHRPTVWLLYRTGMPWYRAAGRECTRRSFYLIRGERRARRNGKSGSSGITVTGRRNCLLQPSKLAFESDITLGSMDTPRMFIDLASCLLHGLGSEVDLSAFDQGAVATGDMVGAFVGNECRGVGHVSEEDGAYIFRFRAWAREETEKLTLQYYTSDLKDIYVYGPACDFLHTQTQKS